MILKNKVAVIYGGYGSLGAAVSEALGAAGAKVYLTGRNKSSLRLVAEKISAQGGKAEIDIVDGFDETGINEHILKVYDLEGHVDISFNAVGVDVVQDIALTKISVDDFVTPITRNMTTRFLTATAAGRIMAKQKSGVILSLTATPGGIGYPYTAGFAPACAAMETFSQNLASELGVYGVRVVNIRSGGSPDSAIFVDAATRFPEIMKTVQEKMKADTMLKRMPPMADIANTAVFLASDLAAGITGVTVDVTCGTTAALNYRATAEKS